MSRSLLISNNLTIMEPNFWLVGSSGFFLIPTYTAIVYNEPAVAAMTGMILLASVLHHSTKPRYPLLLSVDMVLANVGFLYTSYAAYTWWPRSAPSYLGYITYGITVYHLGHRYSRLIWDKDPWVATRWHMSMHLFCSLYSTYSFVTMKQNGLLP